MPVLPMFPLGTVLLPGHAPAAARVRAPLPARSPRTASAAAGEFGVVLIERGSEVGGGDVRSAVGTVARIVEAEELADGRWALATVGSGASGSIALARRRPVPAGRGRGVARPAPGPDGRRRRGRAVRGHAARARRQGRARRRRAAGHDRADRRSRARQAYQILAVAPIGPFDRQALLAAGGPTERLGADRSHPRRRGSKLLEARLGGALG